MLTEISVSFTYSVSEAIVWIIHFSSVLLLMIQIGSYFDSYFEFTSNVLNKRSFVTTCEKYLNSVGAKYIFVVLLLFQSHLTLKSQRLFFPFRCRTLFQFNYHRHLYFVSYLLLKKKSRKNFIIWIDYNKFRYYSPSTCTRSKLLNNRKHRKCCFVGKMHLIWCKSFEAYFARATSSKMRYF